MILKALKFSRFKGETKEWSIVSKPSFTAAWAYLEYFSELVDSMLNAILRSSFDFFGLKLLQPEKTSEMVMIKIN